MADSNQTPPEDVFSRYLSPGGDNVKLVYVLYLVSVVIGITLLVGLIIAYMNRGQTTGTWVESHYTYQIRTFWIGLLYSVISVVLMVVGIGFVLIVVVVIWAIVRCVRGLQWAATGDPVPNPESWIV